MTAPIRIAFPFVGDDVGGSHISALKLMENLDPGRYAPRILLHRPDGLLADYLTEHGIAWRQAPECLAEPFSVSHQATRVWPTLHRYLREEAYDVLHTNDGRVHATWGPAAIGTPCRHLWHHRGDPTARGVNRLAPFLADHLVTVSRFAYPRTPWRSMRGRWSVVHSPFDHPPERGDHAAAHAMLCRELGLADDSVLLGYFGGLIPRKRPQMMAEIVAACREAHPDLPVHAVLFGRPTPGGPRLDLETLERAMELGVRDRVHLMGFRQPVDEWMRAVDMLLVPALDEPFGRTLIEAMLLETPVVATAHGGNVEAIEHDETGLLVDAHAPAAFADPIARLATDGLMRMRLTRVAREQALARYGIAPHVRAITGIYDRLAAARTPRRVPQGVREALR